MTAARYSVTDVALAARCPRQLVLSHEGYRARLKGECGGGIGRAAHTLAAQLVEAARRSAALSALLADREPDAEAVRAHLYTSILPLLHDLGLALAPSSLAADLGRLDGVVRSLCALVAALLVRARRAGVDAPDVVGRVLVASELAVELDFGDARVTGRLDLICEDVETSQRWLWELKTFPSDDDPAASEQVRLYALALGGEHDRHLGMASSPAVLHVTGDRIEMVHSPPEPPSRAEVTERVRAMGAWLSGAAVPPKAASASLCERCSLQAPCWARWGRTLSAAGPTPPPPLKRAPPPVTRAPDPLYRVPPPLQRAPTSGPALRADPTEPPGLWIGVARDGEPVMLPPRVLSRHTAVLGTTGSGKTWLAKVLIEEAVLAGIPALVLDVQGDLAQLLAPRSAADLPPDLRARRQRYLERVEARAWTPASDIGRRVSLNPLLVPSGALPEEKLVLTSDAVAASVVALCNIPASWRRHAVMAVAEIVRRAAQRGRGLDFEALADALAGEEELTSGQRDKLGRELSLLTKGKNQLLYQRGEPLEMDRLLTADSPGKVPLNVVFLNTLPSIETKQQLVAALLTRLYTWMQGAAPGDDRPRLLLMLDEVGPYMPPSREPPSKEILKRLFQEGRKYGVSGLFCTQSFTNVDYKILAQANTKAIGKLGAVQDQKRAEELFPGSKAMIEQLGRRNHTFLLDCPEGMPRTPALVSPRPLLTEHGPPWNEDELARRIGAGNR